MTVGVFSGGANNHGNAGPTAGIRDSLVSLQVQFLGLDGLATSVTDPYVQIFHEGELVSVEAIGSTEQSDHRYPLLAVTGVTGRYKISFLTTRLKYGIYKVEFTGQILDDDSNPHTIMVAGTIAIGEISRLQDWINRVSIGLMDDHPEEYRLDEPVNQWMQDQIYTYIREAVDRINLFPPRLTNYDFASLPSDELAVTGAKIWALWARARLEKANELSYSDTHTLDIKRADFYKQLADSLYKDWMELVIAFKKMTPPTPIGLKSQRLPFRIARVIGLLPNYSNFFSG